MNRLTLLVASLVVASAAPALAADDDAAQEQHGKERHAMHDGGRRGDPQRMLNRLERVLELTDLQRQSIENALLAAKPESDALRTEMRANRAAIAALDSSAPDHASTLAALADERGQLASRETLLRGQVRAAISAELTEEQRAELGNAMERRKGRHGHQRRQHKEGASSGQ